jgi:predicted TIM-barrel fold metal-dependent hydrolase
LATTPIIDADSHVTEPADVWTSRVEKRFSSSVPHVVRDSEGRDVWLLNGTLIKTVGATAPAGWPSFPLDFPRTFEDCHPASYDAKERVRYLDKAGIWAQVLYPNVAGFGSQRFLSLPDEALKLACVRAYNDFLNEEWLSVDRRRLVPIASLPFWDVEASVEETQRCVELGFRGILFTGEPQRFGLPYLGDRYWDPLYATAQEAGLPIHFHIGGGEDTIPLEAIAARKAASGGIAGSTTYFALDLFMKNGVQCVDLISCGALVRFPELKFVSVESGIGWIPFALEAADYVFLGSTKAGRVRSGELLPSDLFRRQVYGTYWFEKVAPRALLEDLPVDNILFETDFPHESCLYENIDETIEAGLAGVPADVQRKFLFDNAANLYDIQSPR